MLVAIVVGGCAGSAASGPWSTLTLRLSDTDGPSDPAPGPPIRIEDFSGRWSRTAWDAEGPMGARSIVVLGNSPVEYGGEARTQIDLPSGTHEGVRLGIGLGPTPEDDRAFVVTGRQANVAFDIEVIERIVLPVALDGPVDVEPGSQQIDVVLDTARWTEGLDFRDAPGDVSLPEDDAVAYAQFLENLEHSVTGVLVVP